MKEINIFRKNLVVIGFMLIGVFLKGQSLIISHECGGKLRVKNEFFERYPYMTYTDFREAYFSAEEKKLFNTFDDLIQIHPETCLSTRTVFEVDSFRLCLTFRNTSFNWEDDLDFYYRANVPNYFGNINGDNLPLLML